MQGLKKVRMIITGSHGKNILLKKKKNKCPCPKQECLFVINKITLNFKNQQLWKSSC